MAGKYHKNYGGVLYARILLVLKDAEASLTVIEVCDLVLPPGYSTADKIRVLRTLNNMHQGGVVARNLEPGDMPHVMRYTFTYHGI